MRLNGLTYECIRPFVQSHVNQYFSMIQPLNRMRQNEKIRHKNRPCKWALKRELQKTTCEANVNLRYLKEATVNWLPYFDVSSLFYRPSRCPSSAKTIVVWLVSKLKVNVNIFVHLTYPLGWLGASCWPRGSWTGAGSGTWNQVKIQPGGILSWPPPRDS